MKNLKALFEQKITQNTIDYFYSILVIPAAYLLLFYRRIGSARLPKTTRRLKSIGVFPIRNHYYEPLFDDKLIADPLEIDRYLPGIDLNENGQINFLKELCYQEELISLNLNQPENTTGSFCVKNGSFISGDADFLYQIIRHIKPNKVVEVGSGNSTKIARLALLKNKAETGQNYKHICIEPYEQPFLESLDGITLLRTRIEDCNFDWKSELQPRDLLFIDSSHIIRPQGDVLKEYLEIFPQLKAGVYVHIHDIFTPKDYLKTWVVDKVKFWNEQYLLEALLTNTNRYEIVAALNYLKHNHYNLFSKVCPYVSPENEPGSFYFKVSSPQRL